MRVSIRAFAVSGTALLVAVGLLALLRGVGQASPDPPQEGSIRDNIGKDSSDQVEGIPFDGSFVWNFEVREAEPEEEE